MSYRYFATDGHVLQLWHERKENNISDAKMPMRKTQLVKNVILAVLLLIAAFNIVNTLCKKCSTLRFYDYHISASKCLSTAAASSSVLPPRHPWSDEQSRFANITDNVDRLRAILRSLPTPIQRVNLKFGFEWAPAVSDIVTISPNMTNTEAHAVFFKYVATLQIKCTIVVRLGVSGEGGWDSCFAEPYNLVKPCLVYSVGISNSWSFDDDVAKKYGCADMAFDPTIKKASYKPHEMIWFHDIGLGGSNKLDSHNWPLCTMGRLRKILGHTEATIDMLKFDVEYSEWEAMEAMLVNPSSLLYVKQIAMEFHSKEIATVGGSTKAADYTYYWLILRGMDALGFKIWRYLPNNCCYGAHACCGMLHFINIAYIV